METEKLIKDIEKLDLVSQVCLTDIIINIKSCSKEKMNFAKDLLRDFDNERIKVIQEILSILIKLNNMGGIKDIELSMLKEYASHRIYFDTL